MTPFCTRLALLAAGLLAAFLPLDAQAQEPRESSIGRARVAVALRDSLLRLNPDMVGGLGEAGIPTTEASTLASFLANPFDPGVTAAPSLNQLDVALAKVNGALLTQREDELEGGQNAGLLAGASPGVGKLGTGLLGGLGLPSQAQLLVGLTDFMVERARDDVAFGFVLTLRNNVRDDLWLRVGLPRSYQLMQRMDDGTYSTFMPVLRAAFVEDLNTLPARAYALADSLGATGEAGTGLYLRGLAIAYQRGLEIRQGTPPPAALANLAGVTQAQMPDPTTRRALVVVGLVAREYTAGGGERMAREIAGDDRGWLRRYLAAFLARDLVETEVATGTDRTNLLAFMSQREADVVTLVNQLEATREVLQDVQRAAQAAAADLREAADEAKKVSDQAENAVDRALASAGAVLQVMSTGQRFLYWGQGNEPASVRVFREFVGDANTLHQAFMKRDYASLVTWAVQRPELRLCLADARAQAVIQTELQRNAEAQIKAARTDGGTGALTSVEQAHRDNLVRERLAERTNAPNRCGVRTQYLSFAASLASARSAEEVTVALRQASAPVGSYRAKRNQYVPVNDDDNHSRRGPLSATLGGYLGVTGGWEQGARHFGAALPVGAEVSYGLPLGAVSFFVPLIDVGTLASTRWAEDEEAEDDVDEADPTFRQVLAPGAFVVLNWSRSIPFSVGFGWQAVPELRERDGERVSVGRWSFFAGADVTVLNFRF